MLQIAHFGIEALASLGRKGHPMVVFTAISPDMANTPGIVEARWCVPGRRRLASVAAPVGLYKKARADQSSFLEGQPRLDLPTNRRPRRERSYR